MRSPGMRIRIILPKKNRENIKYNIRNKEGHQYSAPQIDERILSIS